MGDGMITVALAGDDEAHRLLLEKLADASTPGIEDLHTHRRFVGDGRGGRYLKTGTRPPRTMAPSGRPRYRAQRSEDAPLGYAAVFVEAVQELMPHGDVILMLVDEDGHPERFNDVMAAQAHFQRRGVTKTVVLGVCNPIAEAWLIALLTPELSKRGRLLAKELGFDPGKHPHKLASKPKTVQHHATRALHFLLDDEYDTIMAYPADTPKAAITESVLEAVLIDVNRLVQLKDCGLAVFFEELRRVYTPMVGPY